MYSLEALVYIEVTCEHVRSFSSAAAFYWQHAKKHSNRAVTIWSVKFLFQSDLFVNFWQLCLQPFTKDDATMDRCGRFSLFGDWSSCHSLFAFHFSKKVNESKDWWNNVAQAYTVVYLVVTVGLVIPVQVGVGQRLGVTSLGPALVRLFYQNLWLFN